MTQINHDAVRSAVRELTDNKTISGAALAREIGTSTATVSQFLNGKYKGDNDSVAASLSVWLDNHNAAKTTLPVAPDFVETPTAQKIIATLTWAQLAGTIVLVYGNPGVGKTKAIRQYAASGNNVWHITASKSRSNELETLYELALKMGISDAPYRRGALSRLLRQRLPDIRVNVLLPHHCLRSCMHPLYPARYRWILQIDVLGISGGRFTCIDNVMTPLLSDRARELECVMTKYRLGGTAYEYFYLSGDN